MRLATKPRQSPDPSHSPEPVIKGAIFVVSLLEVGAFKGHVVHRSLAEVNAAEIRSIEVAVVEERLAYIKEGINSRVASLRDRPRGGCTC